MEDFNSLTDEQRKAKEALLEAELNSAMNKRQANGKVPFESDYMKKSNNKNRFKETTM